MAADREQWEQPAGCPDMPMGRQHHWCSTRQCKTLVMLGWVQQGWYSHCISSCLLLLPGNLYFSNHQQRTLAPKWALGAQSDNAHSMYLQAAERSHTFQSANIGLQGKTCMSAPGAMPLTEEWLGGKSHCAAAEGDCSGKDEQDGEQWEVSTEPVLGQYIVRFTSYKMADEHSAAMLAALGQEASWRCLERNNAAARFPTDFALVEIDLEEVETVKVCRA